MHSDLPQGEINLFANRPLRLNKALGICVACTAGTIWITISGESSDLFIAAGQDYILTNKRLALIEAIGGDSCIRLLPAPRRWPGLIKRIVNNKRRFIALARLIAGDRI